MSIQIVCIIINTVVSVINLVRSIVKNLHDDR